MNYTNRPLDIPTAVEYITNMLYIQRGFFIMTDMGRIGIEGIYERDPVDPVSIHKWKDDIKSEWKYEMHNELADLYIQIGVHPKASDSYMKILAMQAVMMAKFYYALRCTPQDYIDASVLAFIYENEREPEMFLSAIEQEFVNIHLLQINRVASSLAHQMVENRIRIAIELLDRSSNKYISRMDEGEFNHSLLSLIYSLRMSINDTV